MTRLPVVYGRELARALERCGFHLDRQKGSHMVLRQSVAPFRRVTVPDRSAVAKGTLRAILRQPGLTVEQLVALLR